MIVTDLCVFSRPNHDSPFELVELAPGVTIDESRGQDDGSLRSGEREAVAILHRESFC